MNTPFSLQSAADRLIASVGQVIKGKDDVIRKTAVCLFCGGHILLEDVPGTGKTTLAKALSRSIDGMAFTRVQVHPRPAPRGFDRRQYLQPENPGIHLPSGAGVYQYPAGGRD